MAQVALPPRVNIDNLSGKWTIDKKRSENYERCLEVQGLSWFIRKAASFANLTQTAYHDGLDLKLVSVGNGVRVSTTEIRKLDWQEIENKISLFGTCQGRSHIVALGPGETIGAYSFQDEESAETEEDVKWLNEGWEREADGSVKLLECQGKCLDVGWRSHQVWGFQTVDGQRRHLRKMILWRGDQKALTILVYDWLGELDKVEVK